MEWINPGNEYDTVCKNFFSTKNTFIENYILQLLKVHIFNYTNIDRYLAGKENKIVVKDVGPFVYREHTKKVETSFNDNFTITFKVRLYIFYLINYNYSVILLKIFFKKFLIT